LRVNLVPARARILVLLFALSPSVASADWLFIPFIGGTFAGSTPIPDFEGGASSTQAVYGGSAGWWSQGIIGVETEFAYSPRFFETNNRFVTDSNVITWGGNVVATMPLTVTRESLRPYLVGGLAWMHMSLNEGAEIFPEFFAARNSLAVNLGGGAVGFITPDVGVRFDLRHFRSFEHGANPVTLENESLLSFWRATVGVVIRR
jgi:hypothetical protein